MNRKASVCSVLTRLFILCLLLTFICACGKKSNPKPRETSRSFIWERVDILPVSGCLQVEASLSGIYTHLKTVVLELSGVNRIEDCSGCPFLASESFTVENLTEVFNPATGELRFSHCPKKPAMSYRYRLIGKNAQGASRHVLSTEGFVLMQESDELQLLLRK